MTKRKNYVVVDDQVYPVYDILKKRFGYPTNIKFSPKIREKIQKLNDLYWATQKYQK